MYRPRIIPCLLLKGKGLVKSIEFKNHRYLGDPINAVRVYNDLRADELMFFDIMATDENRAIDVDLVRQIGDETNMPFTVGGGIRSLATIESLIKAGAERICLNTYALENPGFVRQAADEFGSSTIVVCIDVKRNFWRQERVYGRAGTQLTQYTPLDWVRKMADAGPGELVIQSIEQDGKMTGYDLALTKQVASTVSVPVVALGGCGSFDDIVQVVTNGQASAASAGSFFAYHGPRRAVLVNFLTADQLQRLYLPD